MTSSTPVRPAWVAPTLVVAIFAVVVFAVRAIGQDRGQPPFRTQAVPLPTVSATTEAPARADYGLNLTAAGLGPHQFGTAGNAVLELLAQTLGPPTEDAPEECDSGQEPRLVRWADLSIRIESGQFVAFVEGIYYPPGPPPLAIPTAEGLAPGDPATRLFELYEPASLRQVPLPVPSEREVMQFEIAADGAQPLVVVVEGTADTGTVVAISAGSFCP